MDIAIVVLLVLSFILLIVNMVIGLLVGSVVVQIMEALRTVLPGETRPKKPEKSTKPWDSYL